MAREDTIAQILTLQGTLMRTSMRHHSRTMAGENLTPAQFHLLVFLHSRPGTPTAEAADAMGVKPNIASGVIQRLVERGWVAREPSAHDGRVRLLSLTPSGVQTVDNAVDAAEKDFIDHVSVLSDEQVEQLRGILDTLVAALAADADGHRFQ
ncbi:MarR family winged helix-turn-helix transcriptional regulator [Demequina flava]|uniref:MarR family winged helix-turn-helix transcriptional regulator n=1 Tax=Demequina flava TaxID=1095025 RepID=UPI000784021B|nr:MarR family transcriptional regulator [Demequina flava]